MRRYTKGTPVGETVETKQFTALCAKMLGSVDAFKIMTGHNMLMRVRLSLLRGILKKARQCNLTLIGLTPAR